MKLVEILARELKEWPEGVAEIAQDQNKAAHPYLSAGKFKLGEWLGVVKCAPYNVNMQELSTDYSTAIVTRAQWEAELARTAKPEENKWIRHRGGKCPVEHGKLVDVRHRDGKVVIGVPAGVHILGKSNAGDWAHNHDEGDIMAYRLHKPELKDFKMPDSSGSLNVTVPQTIPAHMILGYSSKEEMAIATGCETMEEVLAKVSSDMDGIIVPSQIDQIDGPIKWRDRVREIDSTVEALEEERLGLIQRLEDEGFQLIKGKAEAQEDMGDWRNWKEGDEVTFVADTKSTSFTLGTNYTVSKVILREGASNNVFVKADDEGEANGWKAEYFKFHSRP